MKYILILLISFAFGQVPILPIGMNSGDYVPEPIQSEQYLPALQAMIDYAEECYNDSTFVDRAVYIRGKFINNPYWTHKEPTFSGFIKWLRSK